MDNTDSGAVGYRNNASIFQVAFILLSVGRSVFVAGSDIGPKVLNIMAAIETRFACSALRRVGSFPLHRVHFASVAEKGQRNGRTKRLEKLAA
jgi:hypothetical protein